MSKLNPLGQSMAALFSNEHTKEAAKSSESSRPNSSKQGFRVPGKNLQGIQGGGAPNDSLGDGNSPGYESWGRKKPKEDKEEERKRASKGITMLQETGNAVIRLNTGWEKLLLVQKKICERAKNLFVGIEAPARYHGLKRGKALALKTRGCIIDVDTEALRQEQESKAKSEKEAA